jgi:hypothetical protein
MLTESELKIIALIGETAVYGINGGMDTGDNPNDMNDGTNNERGIETIIVHDDPPSDIRVSDSSSETSKSEPTLMQWSDTHALEISASKKKRKSETNVEMTASSRLLEIEEERLGIERRRLSIEIRRLEIEEERLQMERQRFETTMAGHSSWNFINPVPPSI